MYRYALLACMGIVFWIIVAACIPAEATWLSRKSSKMNEKDERFCVTIWPSSTLFFCEERFKIIFRVVNATNKPQIFFIMSCSWYEQWETDNPRVRLAGHATMDFNNYPLRIKLQPGEAYERTVQMQIDDGVSQDPISFKVGFIPLRKNKQTNFWVNGTQTYWSNRVVLGIKPSKRK